jgi:hypothetical protein
MFGLSTRRRVATLAIGAGLVAVPLAANLLPSANAAGAEACEYTGNTTSLTPIPVTGANSGSFTFVGSGTCAGQDGTGSVHISASGSYNNIQCGTGTATGTATVTGAVNTSLGFTITFAAGQGVLTVTSGGTGGGDTHIVPNTGGCVTGPATSFSVAGTIAGTV